MQALLEVEWVTRAVKTGTVSEVGQHGSVSELVVENRGDHPVLLLEGEELRGAKQNRIVNTTVLAPARSRLIIPVSCVEQGRWRHVSPLFASSKAVSPVRLRHALKSSVTRALMEKRGPRSDQGKVWDEVRRQQETLGVSSGTSALADTYAKYEEQRTEAQNVLQYVPGATGLAIAVGAQLVSLDVFDKPATCEKVWGRLVSGLVLDVVPAVAQADISPDLAQVRQLVEEIRNAVWTPTETVGDGQELRAELDGKVGSVLSVGGSLVHGSVVGALV
jgi:hypothetical protein